jgi:trehalose 6-phosphate synthase/phosphatase
VSGRRHENLEKWFGKGKGDIDMIAEHGAWIKKRGAMWHKLPGLSSQWKEEIRPVLETFVDRTPGTFIEEKSFSLVWHYRKAQKGLGELRAGELMNNLKYLATDKGLQLLPGNKVVEVKNVEINKGKAAMMLIDNIEYDFIMALGDDYTDEDIFKALPENAITIKIGNNVSAAKFYLRTPHEARRLLKKMAEAGVAIHLAK